LSKHSRMHYDPQQNRWMTSIGERDYPLHCGESFTLYIGKQGFACRLELDLSWYVILHHTRFILHPKAAYVVHLCSR